MTAQRFDAWRETVGARFAADFVRLLGVHRSVAEPWLTLAKAGADAPVRHPEAFAMSAIAQGLKPWDEYEKRS